MASETMKLLRLDVDELYATLGSQLLARQNPTRVAGIVSYLAAVRSAAEAKNLFAALPTGPGLSEWGRGLGVIHEELKREGADYFARVSTDLREALNHEELLRLADHLNPSTLRIVVMVVGAALRLPRESAPISATVSAILCKLGLRHFCGGPQHSDALASPQQKKPEKKS